MSAIVPTLVPMFCGVFLKCTDAHCGVVRTYRIPPLAPNLIHSNIILSCKRCSKPADAQACQGFFRDGCKVPGEDRTPETTKRLVKCIKRLKSGDLASGPHTENAYKKKTWFDDEEMAELFELKSLRQSAIIPMVRHDRGPGGFYCSELEERLVLYCHELLGKDPHWIGNEMGLVPPFSLVAFHEKYEELCDRFCIRKLYFPARAVREAA